MKTLLIVFLYLYSSLLIADCNNSQELKSFTDLTQQILLHQSDFERLMEIKKEYEKSRSYYRPQNFKEKASAWLDAIKYALPNKDKRPAKMDQALYLCQEKSSKQCENFRNFLMNGDETFLDIYQISFSDSETKSSSEITKMISLKNVSHPMRYFVAPLENIYVPKSYIKKLEAIISCHKDSMPVLDIADHICKDVDRKNIKGLLTLDRLFSKYNPKNPVSFSQTTSMILKLQQELTLLAKNASISSQEIEELLSLDKYASWEKHKLQLGHNTLEYEKFVNFLAENKDKYFGLLKNLPNTHVTNTDEKIYLLNINSDHFDNVNIKMSTNQEKQVTDISLNRTSPSFLKLELQGLLGQAMLSSDIQKLRQALELIPFECMVYKLEQSDEKNKEKEQARINDERTSTKEIPSEYKEKNNETLTTSTKK